MKIHLTGICEIAAAACARMGIENQKEPPSALSIARHMGGDERAVRKEWEPLIGAIAGVLMGNCDDFPKPKKPEKEKPEPKPEPVEPEPTPEPEPDTKADKPKKAKKKKK